MKPGIKTTEFWLSLLAMLLPALQTVIDLAPGQGWLPAIVAAIYATSRAYAKANATPPPQAPPANITPIS